MDNIALGRAILAATCAPSSATPEHAEILAREVLRLQDIVSEVNSWIVCAAIASPEDMMQSAEHIEKLTRPIT